MLIPGGIGKRGTQRLQEGFRLLDRRIVGGAGAVRRLHSLSGVVAPYVHSGTS